jgi:hypothetical protein
MLAPLAREGLRIMAGLYWDLGERGMGERGMGERMPAQG